MKTLKRNSSHKLLPYTGMEQMDVLQKLSAEIEQLQSARPAVNQTRISPGCATLDAMLPGGGYRTGSLVEYLRTSPACGASTLALAAAAQAMQTTNGFLVVVDIDSSFYPPVLLSHGIDLSKVIFVRPQTLADAIWAVDQALRTTAVAAVVSEIQQLDNRSARRLQLAAEQGEGLALLLRDAAALRQPSWAEIQWLCRSAVAPNVTQNRTFEVKLARIRGGKAGASAKLELNWLTGRLQPAAAHAPERNRDELPGQSQRGKFHSGKSPTSQRPPSQSAVYLASQLANSTDGSRRAEAG